MTPDPYPDLTVDEAAHERPELSEPDRRLLAALSRPAPAVVTAVEDQPRRGRTVQQDRTRSPLAPVFQEPTD